MYEALGEFERQNTLNVEHNGAPSCGPDGLNEILYFQTPSGFSKYGIVYEVPILATYSLNFGTVTLRSLAFEAPKTSEVPQLLDWLKGTITKFESSPQMGEFVGHFKDDGYKLKGLIRGDYIQVKVGISAYIYYSLPNQSISHYRFPNHLYLDDSQ